MSNQIYVRDVEALATTYWERLGNDERFSEQNFVQNMRKRLQEDQPLTPNMKGCIDRMVEKYIKGKVPDRSAPAPELQPIERGRFSAYKVAGGWQIHVDKEKVGPPVDHKTAGAIIYWLEDAIDEIMMKVALPPEAAAPGVEGAALPF